MRINKFLAECGVASRRNCDNLIKDGLVTVNGKVCKLGQEIDEHNDAILVNGKRVNLVKKYSYYMMNKPKGYVSTVKDDKDRKTVMDLLPPSVGRVFPVGRLDYDSEGLLILTNDGDLCNRLLHPSNEIPKTYLVKRALRFCHKKQSLLKSKPFWAPVFSENQTRLSKSLLALQFMKCMLENVLGAADHLQIPA